MKISEELKLLSKLNEKITASEQINMSPEQYHSILQKKKQR